MATFFAAIAFSQSTRKIGYSWSAPDQATAQRKALENCPFADAVIVGWVRDAWGALAIGEGNGYAFGWGTTSEQAEQAALHEFAKVANSGRITLLLHSQQGEYQPASTTTVTCPHCNGSVTVESKGGQFKCCFCQGLFTFTPTPVQPPKQQAIGRCARCGAGLSKGSASSGDRDYCFSCIAIVDPWVYDCILRTKGFKPYDDVEESQESHRPLFQQVPCWGCTQTGRQYDGKQCPYCGGKGWRLASTD